MHERNRHIAHRRRSSILRRTPLAAAVSAVLAATALPTIALAQDDQGAAVEEIVVTATRREQNIQDIPINIASFDGNALETRAITDLAVLGRNVPGLYVVDQGKRSANQIVVRGLSLTTVDKPDLIGNNGGNVVSTYVGDIPLYVDLALNDMQRVEVLLGPQGTLYGSGTLGGAIRYLPNRPQLEQSEFEFRASTFDLAESDTFGYRSGVTANVPIGDKLALRVNADYYNDPGFIDSPYLVRQVGVSDPEPNLADPAAVAANLYRKNDTNTEETDVGARGFALAPDRRDRRESLLLLSRHGYRRPHGEPRARVRHRQVPGSQPRARAERAHEQACRARDQRRPRLRDAHVGDGLFDLQRGRPARPDRSADHARRQLRGVPELHRLHARHAAGPQLQPGASPRVERQGPAELDRRPVLLLAQPTQAERGVHAALRRVQRLLAARLARVHQLRGGRPH